MNEIEVRELTSAEIDKIDEATKTHELPTLLSLHFNKKSCCVSVEFHFGLFKQKRSSEWDVVQGTQADMNYL